MTQVENLPVRWCPLCGEPATLTEPEWQEIERNEEEILCGDCCRVPRLWLKARPK
jgi:hypothetical protein